MRTEKLRIHITIMGGPRRIGVCFTILVVAVAQAAAPAGDSLQTADGTAEQPRPQFFVPPGDSRKFASGHKIILPAHLRETLLPKIKPSTFHETAETSKDLGMIGGRIIEEPGGRVWAIKKHSYKIDDSEGEQQRAGPVSGPTGKATEALRGEATREGQRHVLTEVSDGMEEEQTSGTSGDEWSDSIHMNSPGEYEASARGPQHSPIPDDESAGWSREADLWRYREGEWKEVRLPDTSYSSLPTPTPPTAALIVTTVDKVKVERRLEGLKNVTIHCRFYLSHSHNQDSPPELEVYFVKNDSRSRLVVETTPGVWEEKTIHVPDAETSSVIIEGWLKAEGNIIALSNLYTTGVTQARDEALDADSDQMTLTANTTENVTSTLDAEGNWTEVAGQDNATRSSTADFMQGDASQSPAEGDTEEGTGTVMPIEESELESSTDIPESETQATEQINENTDIATLNSSMSGSDNMTSADGVSSDFKATTTTTDAENKETNEEGIPTTATVTDNEPGASENVTEDAFGTSEKGDNSTNVSIPVVTTDSLQTNASITLPYGNAMATGGPLTTTQASVNSKISIGIPTETPFTDGQNLSTNVFGTDMGSSGTTFGGLELNVTSENVTGDTVFTGGIMMESPLPTAGNGTEVLEAVPVSSTSWQVFQIFLVLCVMGLLALGFLYWKRKRRQDDEIPVFTRHTDYHNPTFTMEDAANFMSRAGRNTYKTIE